MLVRPPRSGPDRLPAPRRPRVRKILIHAFVAFHVTAVVFWSFSNSPLRTPLEKRVHPKFGRYMYPLGLWQSWIMFAPNPAMHNAYVEAEVTFRDGSRTTWTFPRMDKLGYFERLRKERYRKWANERVVYMFSRPDPVLAEAAAKFVVRQLGTRPDNPPETVELVRYRAYIPPPGRRGLVRYDFEPTEWERQPILTCHFDAAGDVTRIESPATAPSAFPATAPADEPAPESP
jgi:hypothetical protein